MKVIVLILFGACFAFSLFVWHASIEDGIVDTYVLTLCTLMSSVSAYFTWKMFIMEHQLAQLREEALKDRERFESGRLIYKGYPIHPHTELMRFQFTMSFGLLSFKMNSQFYPVERRSKTWLICWHIGISLIFGWWAIPWGPIDTLKTIKQNLRGGEQMTLLEALWLKEG